MKQSVISELTLAEVKEKLIDERAAFTKLKTSHAVSPLENPLRIRETRKTVAILETELKKRMTAEQSKKA